MFILLFLLFIPPLYGQTDQKPDTSAFTYLVPELVITSNRTAAASSGSALEQHLQQFAGVQLISRGRMAEEVMLRGFCGGSVSATIDGIRVHGACVDHMDPITSYVETENLASAQLFTAVEPGTSGGGTAGSINLVTASAEFDSPLRLMASQFFTYRGNNSKSGLIASWGNSNIALRGSFTHRQAGNYYHGRDAEITGSGFRKRNFSGEFAWLADDDKTITVKFLGDYANDVGYPALLMDARRARGEIAFIQVTGEEWGVFSLPLACKVYRSSVLHEMDDFGRPLQEISSRSVMPGMFMPMTGTFSAQGIQLSTQIYSSAYSLDVLAEFAKQSSWADMAMYPLQKAVPAMYLLNVGNANDYVTAVGGKWEYRGLTDAVLHAALRGEYVSRALHNPSAIAALSAFSPGFTPASGWFIPSGSVSLQLDYAGIAWQASAAFASRAPLFTESYGNFLYSPLEESYFQGNSRLQSEKSIRLTLGGTYTTAHATFAARIYSLQFWDFISGLPLPHHYAVNNVPFSQYANTGRVSTIGAEAEAALTAGNWFIMARVNLQRSRSLFFADELPFTPLPSGMFSINYAGGAFAFTIRAQGTLTQPYLSAVMAKEKRKPGYLLLGSDFSWTPEGLPAFFLSVDNLLNSYFSLPYGINNLPGAGREVRAGVRYVFSTEG